MLLEALALVEVTIDWADEDVPEDVSGEVRTMLRELRSRLDAALQGFEQAERLRHGFEVVLVGAPNAGKSSLLNALAGREAALTSAIPGTTRDMLEVAMDVSGLPVTVVDVAGIRSAEDEIERMGVERALKRANQADLRVFLEAPDAPLSVLTEPLWREGDILVAAKADLGTVGSGMALSALTGDGLGDLLESIADVLGERVAGAGLTGHIRQREAVERATAAAAGALGALDDGVVEIAAEELRSGLAALEELAGRVGVEELLGMVFGRFCLGK